MAKLHSELQIYRAKQQENQETVTSLQTALEEESQLSHQTQADVFQQQLDFLTHQLEESNKRVTELQKVRMQLENELSPLRAKHANILSENAILQEGSQEMRS